MKSLLMSGLMMCRYSRGITLTRKFWDLCSTSHLLLRFFYVRYASALIKEGLSLLHKLTLILVTTFIVWHFFMWQGKAWFYGSSFKESIKGKICTKANLTALHEDTVIWKPKLIMISCNIILWLFLRNGLKIERARYIYLSSKVFGSTGLFKWE